VVRRSRRNSSSTLGGFCLGSVSLLASLVLTQFRQSDDPCSSPFEVCKIFSATKISVPAVTKLKVQEAVKYCPEKFGEAWLSCLLTMVQGDVTALTLKHGLIAAKTGGIMATSYFIAVLCTKKQTTYLDVLLTGCLTAIADFAVHPSHFGGPATEAIVTGMGAAFLALLLHLITRK